MCVRVWCLTIFDNISRLPSSRTKMKRYTTIPQVHHTIQSKVVILNSRRFYKFGMNREGSVRKWGKRNKKKVLFGNNTGHSNDINLQVVFLFCIGSALHVICSRMYKYTIYALMRIGSYALFIHRHSWKWEEKKDEKTSTTKITTFNGMTGTNNINYKWRDQTTMDKTKYMDEYQLV